MSQETAAALRAQANSLTDQFGNARALVVKDSFVIGSAMRDGVSADVVPGRTQPYIDADNANYLVLEP